MQDRTPGTGKNGRERFVFGIPLIARARANDWKRVDFLLGLTLRSLLAQTDAGFEVLLAGHDMPSCWRALASGDARFRFLAACHPADAPTPRNDDAGIKKWMIRDHVARSGGGLLMYLDADDLVDRDLVATARARIAPDHVGGVVAEGIILDFASLRAASLPDARIYDGPFLELCGSSTIGRIEPASADPARRDPFDALGSHHVWPAEAASAGLALACLPVRGAYLVNTRQNHSESHGPHADWRRSLNAAVAREGAPFGPDLAARFGLGPDDLRAASREQEAGSRRSRPSERKDPTMSETTTDHDTIRKWAEGKGGKPAAVDRTHSDKDVGIIRIMFPDAPNTEHDALVEISWDEFFREFEERELALVYEKDGMFSKIVGRDTAEKRAKGDHGAAR